MVSNNQDIQLTLQTVADHFHLGRLRLEPALKLSDLFAVQLESVGQVLGSRDSFGLYVTVVCN